jgi:glycosyltransferase involved in cell wall biosynthesis
MVGSGHLLGRVRLEIASRDLADRFRLLGAIAPEGLGEVYAAADVFLLTSDYEGFGRVVVEASRAGLPVVSTETPGPDELVEPGVNGFLAPPGDAEALADAVARLLEDDELRQRLGAHARSRMEDRFSPEALAERVVDFWEGKP